LKLPYSKLDTFLLFIWCTCMIPKKCLPFALLRVLPALEIFLQRKSRTVFELQSMFRHHSLKLKSKYKSFQICESKQFSVFNYHFKIILSWATKFGTTQTSCLCILLWFCNTICWDSSNVGFFKSHSLKCGRVWKKHFRPIITIQ